MFFAVKNKNCFYLATKFLKLCTLLDFCVNYGNTLYSMPSYFVIIEMFTAVICVGKK
jgi:hypothetical protein